MSVLLVVVSSLHACGKQTSAPSKEFTRTERSQLMECIETLSTVMGATPESRVPLFAKGCGRALGFDKLMGNTERLMETTDFFCNAKVGSASAAAEPSREMSILVDGCGAEYYGLNKDNAQHMSVEWFLGQRTAAWIADIRTRADTELVTRLDSLMADFKAPLPFPPIIEGAYSLPEAHQLELDLSRTYVLITQDSVKVMTTKPSLLLTDKGAIVDQRATTVSLDKLAAHLTNQPQTLNRKVGGSGFGSFFGNNNEDNLVIVDPADNAALIIADAALSAARVLEVAEALGEQGVHLGVRQGLIILHTQMSFGSRTANIDAVAIAGLGVQVALNDDEIQVWIRGHITTIGRISGEYDLEPLEDLLKEGGKGTVVLVSAVGATATYQDLVNVLDAAANVGLKWATTGTVDFDAFTYGLDERTIQRFIGRHMGRIHRCYEKELLVKPNLAGEVVVNFTINAPGNVENVKAEGMDEKVSACITEIFKAIRFPKPKGGDMKVRYPFTFKTPG